jgi:hypothetical protein
MISFVPAAAPAAEPMLDELASMEPAILSRATPAQHYDTRTEAEKTADALAAIAARLDKIERLLNGEALQESYTK